MRQISAETVEWFKTACNSGELSRSALARELCLQENWFGRVGRLCLASARKLLPRLAEELGLRLPEAEAMEFDPHARPASDFADSSVSSSLRELGPLSLEPVASPEERRRWEAMIETIIRRDGAGRREGRSVTGFVRSGMGCWAALASQRRGCSLGRATMSSAGRAMPAWPTSAGFVCNHRFLLLPGVRVKGLASRVCVLRRAGCRRLGGGLR